MDTHLVQVALYFSVLCSGFLSLPASEPRESPDGNKQARRWLGYNGPAAVLGARSWCQAIRTGAHSLEADAVPESLPWVPKHTYKEGASIGLPAWRGGCISVLICWHCVELCDSQSQALKVNEIRRVLHAQGTADSTSSGSGSPTEENWCG